MPAPGTAPPVDDQDGRGKRVLIVGEVDGYANGQKPAEIARYLRDRGHDVVLFDTLHLSRASSDESSPLRKLPHPAPKRLALYLVQFASLLLTRRWKWGKRHLSYHLIRADLRLRRRILSSSLSLDEFDMIIGEHPIDSELMTVPTSARKLYDCMTPWADELYFEDSLTEAQHRRFRRQEAEVLERADLLSFSWESYAPYAVTRYRIGGENLLQLNWGCQPVRERVKFADPPRIVLLSSLSSNFINLPLLSRLAKLYPIDVYGGPPPDPSLGINYLGWAQPAVLGDYQIGLITSSTDELRREGFSAKTLQYIAHGLPVMVPAWRRHMELIRGCVPYEEDTFLSVIESLGDQAEWQRVSDEAYEQAQELAWERTLKPLDEALRDPGYRYSTPYMERAIKGRSDVKRVLIVGEVDGYANGQKPVEVARHLREQGHHVELVDTLHLSRASSDESSPLRKLPHPAPKRLALYLVQFASLLLTRRWKWGKHHLSYHMIRADLRLRRSILSSSLSLDEFDMIIGEHPIDSELMTVPTSARTLYDCATPWADELHFEGMLTEAQHRRFRRQEAELYEHVDLLSFHWETYASYAITHYGIGGENLLQLNTGCAPARERVGFADPPRVVFLSSLSSNFINLPLLSRLAKLYPIDVYGGPPPDPSLGLNYLGWASPSVLSQYQVGLITCSTDELRREGFSNKTLQYIAHGLPVMVPAWRRHMELIRGCVPYEEDTFLSVIESLGDQAEWQRVSDEAYEQAQELAWERTLKPLDEALRDPGYRHVTPHIEAAIRRGAEGVAASTRGH